MEGRRRNTAYVCYRAYVPKELYKRLRVAIIEDDTTISELMEGLVKAYLSKREELRHGNKQKP